MIFTFRNRHRDQVPRERRIPTSEFDNWYIHCPICKGVLVLRMERSGPRWACLCRGGESRNAVESSQ
jgi:hypothetical protein